MKRQYSEKLQKDEKFITLYFVIFINRLPVLV